MANYWPHRGLADADWFKGFWEPLVDDFAAGYGFTADFTAAVKKHGIARLIARIPFLAGCSQPKRLAAEHLATFLNWGLLKKHFYHQPGETLRGRLAGIGTFPDGDPAVLGPAMDLLELLSLFDHVLDRDDDRKNQKFNPVNSGDVDPITRGQALLNRIRSADKGIVDVLFEALGGGMTLRPGEGISELLDRWKKVPGIALYWFFYKDPPWLEHGKGPVE